MFTTFSKNNNFFKSLYLLINNTTILYAISFFTIFYYFLPYFLYGEDLYITTYDNLDSNIVWNKILAESGMIFSPSMEIIPNSMNGLPRISYGSEFNVILWLYYFFEPFTAYVVNDIFIHIFAFFSMLTLLENYIFDKNINYRNLSIFTISLLFSLVPFWPSGGLSVTSQPLVLYAFLNFREEKSTFNDWLILTLIPLYSSFVLTYVFFLSIVSLVIIYDYFKTKKLNKKIILAFLYMVVIFLLIEYRLVISMLLDNNFVSHRVDFNLNFRDFDTCYKGSHLLFLNGQDHNFSLQYKYILPTILLGLFLSLNNSYFSKKLSIIVILSFISLFIMDGWDTLLAKEISMPFILLLTLVIWLVKIRNKVFPLLLIAQILISYLTGFLHSEWVLGNLSQYIPILNSFHLRFLMLQTLIWYILLFISIKEILYKIKYSIVLLLLLIIFQIQLAFSTRTFIKESTEQLSFKQFYAKEVYKEIDIHINKPKESYKIVSLGMVPEISLYNGFYTADGYSTNYPLEYKYRFRKVITKYLDNLKSHQGDKHVFDDWGSKIYILTGKFIITKYTNKILKELTIDIDSLRNLDVEYIFSSYEISDYDKLKLKFLKKFTIKNYHPVFVYKIEE